MPNATILAFAGSARTDSFNKKLAHIAARGAEAAGASVTLIDLRDFELPVYDSVDLPSGGLGDLTNGGLNINDLVSVETLETSRGLSHNGGQPGGAVPAPGALFVLGLGALTAGRRRRR